MDIQQEKTLESTLVSMNPQTRRRHQHSDSTEVQERLLLLQVGSGTQDPERCLGRFQCTFFRGQENR